MFAFACGDDPDGIRDVPVTSERELPGLEDEVYVLRTELNVPHVYAKSMLDLAKVQGFVMARDRYVQIELTRRFGAGTLSELLGELGLDIDVESRRQGLREIAQRIWDNAGAEQRARFEGFAEGVNLYIEDVKRQREPLPEEIELVGGFLGFEKPSDAMQKMTGFDIAAASAVIVSRLGYESIDLDRAAIEESLLTAYTSSTATVALADLRRAGVDRDIVHAYRPVHGLTQAQPGVRQDTNALSPRKKGEKAARSIESGTLARATSGSNLLLKIFGKSERGEYGSNSWAVSSKGTGGRGAILANDGHLPLTVPSLFYQMCLDSTYFNEDVDYSVCGLFFPGLPMLAVGTNGSVAWGQTYLDADITDWYREEVKLGADGQPEATMFQGEWKRVVRTDEQYGIPKSGSPEELEPTTVPRYSTFDGRRLISIEGDFETPSDVDGNGTIDAVSLDWTALDITKTVEAVDGFAHSKSVAEFIEVTRKLIGYGQNIIVADKDGAIAYTAYHALPCREYLPKDGASWRAGASPMALLDGTQYGGFTIQANDDGRVKEDGNCVIPFDVGPRTITPEAGYVVTANHDPLGNALDNSLSNDQNYIGGPWDIGYRADTIDSKLAELASAGRADADAMAVLQGDHKSPLGKEYAPVLLDSITYAYGLLSGGGSSADDQRVLAALAALGGRETEVRSRLEAWLARGAIAESGVDTFYEAPSAEQKQDAVATMIHGEWMRRVIDGIFADEGIDFAFNPSRGEKTFRAMHFLMAGRGANNPLGLASWNPATQESVFFDKLGTPAVERSHEIILSALGTALDHLKSTDGFNSTDMGTWLWGLKHHVRFTPLLEEVAAGNPIAGLLSFKFALNTMTLPLAENLPANDPRAKLENFPRPGDFFSVDVAAGGFSGPYNYSHGPVMRMVITLDGDRISGRNILPGGQSGLAGNEHFADQAAMWLGNKTVPIRYHAADVVEGAVASEKLIPPK